MLALFFWRNIPFASLDFITDVKNVDKKHEWVTAVNIIESQL